MMYMSGYLPSAGQCRRGNLTNWSEIVSLKEPSNHSMPLQPKIKLTVFVLIITWNNRSVSLTLAIKKRQDTSQIIWTDHYLWSTFSDCLSHEKKHCLQCHYEKNVWWPTIYRLRYNDHSRIWKTCSQWDWTDANKSQCFYWQSNQYVRRQAIGVVDQN